jgi:pimeloyl-ACP methyl ester carboxylesterase
MEEFDVPVTGGSLRVCRWPGPGPVVLAAHGITANALAFGALAEALAGRVTLVAPDLRGRAGSAGLPGPWGMAAHAADLIAVADHLGLDRVPLVGHSMGGFVVASTAAAYPDRVSAVLLVDGGVSLPVPPDLDVDAVLHAVIGPAMQRLAMTFPSADDYVGFFRRHPALRDTWSPATEAYVRRDLAGIEPELRSSCVLEAIRADGTDTLLTESTVRAVHQLKCPARLIWAQRGLQDEEQGLYDEDRLAAAGLDRDRITVERVADVNHYSILLAPAGVQRVAERVCDLAHIST